ncbi:MULTISPECIES: response regulator transcription factor [unclassified Neptuniibacter]|uniref:response regulator n=1 Tax=unclassified Neptuniibacter TaxID=2630693 RepID=UPI0025F10BBC|nr:MULTISPECIES: response regulator transcription factor [unclassified Neptuniibacter]|tara:strand:- start:554 stop:1210 length:657 start_codon:yes stop_codon:yes gene_type:complete
MKSTINILLVDDHEVVRLGFQMLLSSYPQIGEISTSCCGEEALTHCRMYQPDVVVMDLSMPGIGGLEAIRRILRSSPDTIILVYSIHEAAIYEQRSIQAGARGYINKNRAAEVLAEAIFTVSQGEMYSELPSADTHNSLKPASSETDPIEQKIESLSPREFDVFCLLAKGMNTREISENLCLGYKTIANYSSQIKNKLNANTLVDLTYIAMNSGLIKL